MTDWKMPDWMSEIRSAIREICILHDKQIEEIMNISDRENLTERQKRIIYMYVTWDALRSECLLFTPKELIGGMPQPFAMKKIIDRAKEELRIDKERLLGLLQEAYRYCPYEGKLREKIDQEIEESK